MTWKTPKIVEVPVGMEINMYACAAAQLDCIETICPALAALPLRAAADVRFEIFRFWISRHGFKAPLASTPHRQISEFRKLLCIENLPKRQGVRLWQKKRCHSIPH